MTALVFSGFLAVSNPQGFNEPGKEAARHIAKAIAYELELDKISQRLEKRYLPKRLKEYATPVGILIRGVSEKKISYTWSF